MTTLKPDQLRTKLFIEGEWREATTGRSFPVVNPSTEEEIAFVSDADEQDATAAVDSASAALPAWSATAPRERAQILLRCYELMTLQASSLAELIAAENGKTMSDALGEVAYAAEFFRWYSEEAVRIPGELYQSPGGTNRIMVQSQPIGVCLLITPWNFPAAMATRKIAPALAAGCTVVLKAAAATPLTAAAVAEIMTQAGLPPGVVNIVSTTRPGPVVEALMNDARVRKLSFTGSTEVGRQLLKQAADRVINCSMELGGNAPFIVLEDADLDEAIEGLMIAKMRNTGQACTAANRIFVHTSVRSEFVSKLTHRMSNLVVGPSDAPETTCGPVIDLKATENILRLIKNAVAQGASLATTERKLPDVGYFVSPTVLDGVHETTELATTEVFGPVAAVIPFRTEEEVIAAANRTEYGLAAYVYTRDLARGLRISEQLEAGMVGLNRGMVSDAAAPFGGWKQSGLGREGSHHGLLEYCELKYTAVTW